MSSITPPPEWRSQAENRAETSRRREVVPETGRHERPRGKYAKLFELLRANPLLRTQVMNTGIAAWRNADRKRVRFQWHGYTLTIYSTFCRFYVDDYRGRELCCRYH